ncbi:MAG: hypothetical protein QW291_09715 [Thermofilaceae archaeon]
MPIATMLGLCILMLLSYIAGFIIIHRFVLTFFNVLFISLFAYNIIRKNITISLTISVSKFIRIAVVILLNIIPFAYFTVALDVMKWPPPGDIIAHGLQVSLLRYNGKTLLTFEPLSPDVNYYPRGFHVFIANLAELTKLYSGEAIFITGAFLSALIPPLLFSLTYLLTNSFILSLIPYVASFHVHSTRHLERWVFGYFFNGPYPCLSGMIIYILLISLLVIFYKTKSRIILYSIILVLAQLFFTYPNFFFTALLSILFIYKPLLEIIKQKYVILILIIISITALLSIFTVGKHYIEKWTLGFDPEYKISLSYFSDWTTLILFIAIPFAVYLLVKKIQIIVSLFYLLALLLNLISINDLAYKFLSIILPSRHIIINWLLSWIILCNFISNFFNYIENSSNAKLIYFTIKYGKIKLIKFKIGYNMTLIQKSILIFIIFYVFYPHIYDHISLHLVNYYSWYTGLPSFPFDYNISVWVSQNIASDELILNDMSFSGLYIPSFTYKSIIFHYFKHPPSYDKARFIWLYPHNVTMVKEIIKELNIKWIVVTSEWGYLDLWMYGGSGLYKEKPLKPKQYITIFDSYSFLEKVYEDGNSAVYRVSLKKP